MRLHGSCTTDQGAPRFDHEWQRRAFGLAVALSEFGHYRWEDFQRALIETIGRWERAPESQRGDWEYYDHWVAALQKVIDERGLLTTTTASAPTRHH
jgi:nitrile hydratase accessory protein